jgi:hypothetical protein
LDEMQRQLDAVAKGSGESPAGNARRDARGPALVAAPRPAAADDKFDAEFERESNAIRTLLGEAARR